MVNTKVNLNGIILDNPIIPASGTYGFGYEFAELYDINILGTLSFKGTTLEPRFGNPTPRIAECPEGMLNAVGLQNPGVDAVIAKELPRLREVFHKPVMANVSGFSEHEYVETVRRLDSEPYIGWFEVNISCPNVHGGGMSFGTSPEAAGEITRAVRRVTKKPLIIKLSPNVTDICSIAKACEAEGADGISLINTLLGMRIDMKKRAPLLANKTGGFSGLHDGGEFLVGQHFQGHFQKFRIDPGYAGSDTVASEPCRGGLQMIAFCIGIHGLILLQEWQASALPWIW